MSGVGDRTYMTGPTGLHLFSALSIINVRLTDSPTLRLSDFEKSL